MRWIQQGGGKANRGKGTPPDGDVHFVDEQGSKAIVGGRLYIDGQLAAAGSYEIALPDLPPDQVLTVDVDAKGKAAKKINAKTKPPKGAA